MYSAWQRASVLGGYFMYALMTTLAIIAALNYTFSLPQPSIKLSVDRVTLKRGLEDYYTTKNAWLADFYLSLEAGKCATFSVWL